ncbi:hypothetical protein [Paenibacillus sp. 1_12]|uniref:hypothetical protein n=1 Tax=Paenibacillus sp. 1_12 TaxID=1566278 RepID=UPI001160A5FC|nr:hypothetical protein [Paenibacillus sp. 1_12]
MPEQFRENADTITAAVYISVINMERYDADRAIATKLQKIHAFVDRFEIVLIESYIDRDVSILEWNRLNEDTNAGRYHVILHCGEIRFSSFTDFKSVAINVQQQRISIESQ